MLSLDVLLGCAEEGEFELGGDGREAEALATDHGQGRENSSFRIV
jgi:hypothetical protein